MTLLILFSFIGGIITILSPCILPILPIVLSTSAQEGKRRPLGVATGFIASFTFFTLFLSSIVRATGLSANSLRTLAAITILSFGLVMVVPRLQSIWENLASRLASKSKPSKDAEGFKGGLAIGVSLGLIWTPCVGPILASIITLAATASVGLGAVLITLAYAAGTAIPMLGLIYAGKKATKTLPYLKKNSKKIQQIFGILMILTALAIQFSLDRKFQSYILERFPGYGAGLTSIEDTSEVRQELNKLRNKEDKMSSLEDKLSSITKPMAPELEGGGNWINSDPLTLQELKGKVVLIDFWTYSCINCIRTLPHLKSWHEKYEDEGLVIIGVHSPEFEFEKDEENVRDAIRDFGIEYPVVQDNDFLIWRAYDNHYWPAKYLIDHEGRVRYTHFGEGEYDKTEEMIRSLLEEAGKVVEEEEGEDMPAFRHQTNTPETYLGYWRISNFASNEGVVKDKETRYSAPNSLPYNHFAYKGLWTIGYQHAEAQKGSEIEIKFDAKDVHLVMRPTGSPSRAKVMLDGKPISEKDAGEDVNQGVVTLDKDRLYTLVNLDSPGEHTLEIIFENGNVEVFAFTFG